ncbi:hypothetical protein Trydic_g18065 [Trypoxylus dichotomus]
MNAHKILTIFPAPTYRHYALGYTLSKALAARGHDVTLLASLSEKKPVKNLRILPLTGTIKQYEKIIGKRDLFGFGNTPVIFIVLQIGRKGSRMVEGTLADEVVQNLLRNGTKFDAVIIEHFYTDGLLALAHHFGAQPIIFSALGPSAFTNSLVANPDIPSYVTQPWLIPPIHKVFYKRVHNTLVYIYQTLYDNHIVFPEQNKIVQNEPLPKLPNMIEIGGYHIESPKELPEDLRKILDDAKNGVIYFSLGSELKSENLPFTLRRGILRAFSKMKQTVLWKYGNDSLSTPANVITRRWFPQSDLLAHPNIKLFITHYRIFIQRCSNDWYSSFHPSTDKHGKRSYGVSIDFLDFSEKTLSIALEEVLHNPIKYSQNVKRGSQILRDQQTNPADRAEF